MEFGYYGKFLRRSLRKIARLYPCFFYIDHVNGFLPVSVPNSD